MPTTEASFGVQPKVVTLPVHLNYRVPVEAKQGGLDECVPYIRSDNFREIETQGERDDEAVLVNFGESIKTAEEVTKRLEEMGLRAGTASELADLQQRKAATAPGSSGGGPRRGASRC